VIATTGDGAAVMVAFGKLFPFTYLLCLSHALHLAVSDIIYNKRAQSAFNFVVHNESSDEGETSDTESATESMNEEDAMATDDPEENDVNDTNYGDVITRMRKIIKIFRRSSYNNDILQKKIVEEFDKELSLILDTPTRWNSLLESAARFLRVVDCIKESLLHPRINEPFLWSDGDTKLLRVSVIILFVFKNNFFVLFSFRRS
jgi:hypothetical protein